MCTTKTFRVTSDEYLQHTEEYDGICLDCGDWTEGGIEPDARGRRCDACGAYAVVGAEDALLRGRLAFS